MLDLNIDYDFTHEQSSPEHLHTDSTSSIILNGTSASDEELHSTTLYFDILNTDHQIPFPPGIKNLFPAPAETHSSSVVAPQWLNLSFSHESEIWSLQQQTSQVHLKPVVKKSRRGPRSRSSPYRGVTFYRRTGRWESHIWDCGKQVYLGGYETAHTAARAYDRAAIKFRGVDADINFELKDYDQDMKRMAELSKEEFVHILRRKSTGFARSSSKYRDVVLQKYCRSEAGQALGKRYNGEVVANIDTNSYSRCSQTSDSFNKGTCYTLDLSLAVSPTYKGSCSPVLYGQPPHGYLKLSPPVWKFAHPSASGFSDWSVQVPLGQAGNVNASMQFLPSAASSGFSSCFVPIAPPTRTVAPPLSRSSTSGSYCNYKN